MGFLKQNKVGDYLSLVKFSHTIFAMPFAMIGFFLAINRDGYKFEWQLLIFVLLCMVFARNAAMGFNRYSDRKIDEKNPRTSRREIPAGIIGAQSALWFVIVNAVLFIAATWFINRLVFFLSPVALIVILGYSITKKFTALCHFILGLGLSLAPIGAYLAVTAEFHPLPILFSVIVLTWVSGFDIIYALQDEEFDKNENLYSVPAYFGKKTALLISIAVHLISAILIFYAGYFSGAGLLYFAGATIFTFLLIYQHLLVKPDDLSRVNLAFMTLNGIGSVVFACFTVFDLYFRI